MNHGPAGSWFISPTYFLSYACFAMDSRAPDENEGLANPLKVERHYVPDRRAMLVSLRVALGLPKPLSGPGGRNSDGQ